MVRPKWTAQSLIQLQRFQGMVPKCCWSAWEGGDSPLKALLRVEYNGEYRRHLKRNNLWSTPDVRVQILVRGREGAWEKFGMREIAKALWQLPHQPVYFGMNRRSLCLEICFLWAGFSGQPILSAVGWAGRRSFSAFIKDCIRVHSKHDSETDRKDAVAWEVLLFLVTAPCAGRSPVVTQAKMSVLHICI